MTAAIALEQRQLDRSEQLEQLRRQMAAVSGKVGVRWRAADPADDQVDGLVDNPVELDQDGPELFGEFGRREAGERQDKRGERDPAIAGALGDPSR